MQIQIYIFAAITISGGGLVVVGCVEERRR
jgi:hypothetical protein